MNSRLLRGILYGFGFALPIWGLILSFFTAWFLVPIVAGVLLLIVAGLVDWCADDAGYSDTVYGDVTSEPAWRDDILRRDPQAYPLTKRGVWPDIGAPE